MLKVALLAEFAAVGVFAANTITSAEQAVVLAAAALGGVAVFIKAARSAHRGLAKAGHGYSVLLGMDDRLGRFERTLTERVAEHERHVLERLELQDRRLGTVEGALDVLADEERLRMVRLLERGENPGRRAADIRRD